MQVGKSKGFEVVVEGEAVGGGLSDNVRTGRGLWIVVAVVVGLWGISEGGLGTVGSQSQGSPAGVWGRHSAPAVGAG